MSKKSLKFTSWEVVRRLLVACISFVILIGIITLSFYYKEVNRERENFKDREERNVDILKEIITTHLELVVSDLVIISKIKELKEFINIDSETNRGALAKVFLLYSKQKGLYDQIRFINEKGMEIVRINFNDGEPYIVPEDELQDKGKRYYFRDTFGLDRGEAFVSPFDLNIEEGEIEQPLKPMIRLGIPVFDSNGEKRGIVLLNYLGRNLLEHFEWVSASTSAGEVMLLNSDGFWLRSPRREDEWGFMYEDRANLTFGNAFSGAWQEISGNDSGHFNNTDGLFMFTTFTTIYPLSENMKSSTGSGRAFEPSEAYVDSGEFSWKIVSRITPATLYKNPKRLLHKLLLWDSVILVIFTVGSWLLAYTAVKRKQAEVALRKSHDELEIKVEERTQELAKANEELKAANQQLRASEQQLQASNQQLRANEQQLRAEITERIEAQEGMKRAAEEWRATFDSTKELISIHGIDYKLIRVNRAFANTFKAHPKELVGRNCFEVIHGMTEPRPDCPHSQALKTRKPVKQEYFEPHLGLYLEVSVSPIVNEKGEVFGTVHVVADITERKKMEEDRKKHLHELEVFYKANIGREERIVELKKRIGELEAKLGKKIG